MVEEDRVCLAALESGLRTNVNYGSRGQAQTVSQKVHGRQALGKVPELSQEAIHAVNR